ncbi:MAG: hypothetical protein KGO51_13390, partial [Alphaproteobacteria bacterium]|nr:hypothetical protein [Alphaproteobacteria bacterium]
MAGRPLRFRGATGFEQAPRGSLQSVSVGRSAEDPVGQAPEGPVGAAIAVVRQAAFVQSAFAQAAFAEAAFAEAAFAPGRRRSLRKPAGTSCVKPGQLFRVAGFKFVTIPAT